MILFKIENKIQNTKDRLSRLHAFLMKVHIISLGTSATVARGKKIRHPGTDAMTQLRSKTRNCLILQFQQALAISPGS